MATVEPPTPPGAANRPAEPEAGAPLLGRVAHVMRHYGGPSQPFVVDAVTELDRIGWQAWVVASRIENREWYPFPPADRVVLARRPPAGRRIMGRVRRRSRVERTADWFQPAIDEVAPAVIQAHFGWSGISAYPAAERLGVPLVVSFHATDVTVFPEESPTHRAAYERMFARMAGATAVSRFTEGQLRRAGYSGPVEIVPAGVRLDLLRQRATLAPEGAVKLLFIGRLVPRKGLDLLLRSLALLQGRDPRLTLEVVGDGPLKAESSQLVAELGLGDRVTFAGAVPQSEVRARLEGADILVIPSRTTVDGEAEGSPTVTKEAFAVGVQVVATDCGGTVETIPPEQQHEIVPEDDPRALADRIAALVEHRDAWPDRAAAGRRWVEQQFDAVVLAGRMSELYRRLV